MTTPLVVNNTTYNYPVEGEPAGWGSEATGWASAVTAVLASLAGGGNIQVSTFSPIADNQSSAANITGLSFNTATASGFRAVYYVTRTSSNGTITEFGQLFGVFNSQSATWTMNKFGSAGDAGITFTITSAGQIQYTTTNHGGSSYSGSIKFKAESL